MADFVSVSTQVNAAGQPVSEVVNFSDTKNNSFTIIGIPGQNYNLAGLSTGPSGPSNVTAYGLEINSTIDASTSFLFNSSSQETQPQQLVSFTDPANNTMSLIGNPNVVYDLNLLWYLLGIVSNIDTFMNMLFGESYEQAKHEKLNLVQSE
jgi:hypothetical protein